jgi:glycosyltransferase involved in cell wall biosynthesis
MSKLVLVLVDQADFDPNRRYSAVASVVKSLAESIYDIGSDVSINGEPLEAVMARPEKLGKPKGISRYRAFYRWIPRRLRQYLLDWRNRCKVRELGRRLQAGPRYDCIVNWISIGSSLGARLSDQWNVPLLAIYDNPLIDEYSYLHGFPPLMERAVRRHEERVLRRANRLVLYSPAVEAVLRKRYIFSGEVVFRAFTDHSRMKFDLKREPSVTGELRVVYIGSFFAWHEVRELVAAVLQLLDDGHKIRVTLVGDGQTHGAIKEMVERSVHSDAFCLPGRLDLDSLDRILTNVDLGIIPGSMWFQAPVKFFQYGAAGLAILAKASPTIDHLASGCDGVRLFDSAAGFKVELRRMIDGDIDVRCLGASARTFMAFRYSRGAYADFFRKALDFSPSEVTKEE